MHGSYFCIPTFILVRLKSSKVREILARHNSCYMLTSELQSATSSKLKVTLDDPEHGSIYLLISYGEAAATIWASYTPYDSFLDLADGLRHLLIYECSAVVNWSEEPSEYELRFNRKGEVINLEICYYPDHRRNAGRGESVLAAAGTYQEICMPFWRALRNLQGRFTAEELDRRWHRPFPFREIDRLTAEIKKAQSIAG